MENTQAVLPQNKLSFDEICGLHGEIVSKLIAQLQKLPAGSGRIIWTKSVKETMERLPADMNLEPKLKQIEFYGTLKRGKKTYREWLIDVVWYFRSEGNATESILLALESEWERTPRAVGDDFCKLLAVKAPIKIMLFEGCEDTKKYISYLNSIGNKWSQHTKGDLIYAINFGSGTYATYFCEIADPPHEFELKSIVLSLDRTAG